MSLCTAEVPFPPATNDITNSGGESETENNFINTHTTVKIPTQFKRTKIQLQYVELKGQYQNENLV